MKNAKQKLLLEYILSNPDLWALSLPIIKPSYFDLDLREAVKYCISYYNQYNAIPPFDLISAESGVELKEKTITGDVLESIPNDVEGFCKKQAMRELGLKLPELTEKEDFGLAEKMIHDIATLSLRRNIGTNYFADPETRLRNMQLNERTISTGWSSVDKILGGGITRKELLLFLGESGGGKSIAMLNLARNLLAQGFNGVYYTFELSEEVVARRMDMLISGQSFVDVIKNIEHVAGIVLTQKFKMGRFIIKQFPASVTSANDIIASIKEIHLSEGFVPDFIILDYLDLMAPVAKVSHDNLFIKEKYVSEEVRNIGFRFDAMIISASQLNRSAINNETHDQGMISGGISKINTSGWSISLKRNDVMRSAGEVQFQFLKTRSSNGLGRKIMLDWNDTNLLITDSTRYDPNDLGQTVSTPVSKVEKPNKGKMGQLFGMFDSGSDNA